MSTTLESFVAKLQADGVEAGRREAERLVVAARSEAERVVGAAEAEAKRIEQAAAAEAQRQRERIERELEHAVRDGVLRLRAALNDALDRVIREAVTSQLGEAAVVERLLGEVVRTYGAADASGKRVLEVNVAPELAEALSRWSIGQVGHAVTVNGGLSGAGFEYRVGEGCVEVTPDAAAQVLKALASPRLRQLLENGSQISASVRQDRSPADQEAAVS